MKVSIVIPNYNGKHFLEVCLNSLFRQTFNDFEIIVVDNGSIDGSKEYILANYPDIKLIALNNNYGFSKAVNEGIKSSKGEYVVLLNNDTEAVNDWLYNLIKCIEVDKTVFSCSSKMLRFNERNIIDDAGDNYTLLGWAYKLGDGDSKNKFHENRKVFSSCGGAAIYRKDVFNLIGYFDESFFAYMEDVDIGYRANIYGYKNILCSTALIYHIGSATSGSKYNSFKVKLAAQNNILVVLKNMPLVQLAINFPFLLLGFLIKYIFFKRLGYSKEYRDGMKAGLSIYKNVDRNKVVIKNVSNYIRIELIMIRNTVSYLLYKILGY